ncbi:hemerythrin [Spirochaetia bacterium]|nr:hemerythrin [Spirochaetia bacterium]
MKTDIIEWNSHYAVGIEQIDNQHRKLLDMANNLCLGCGQEDKSAKVYFQMTIHEMINFLKYHFSTEEQILKNIRYPDIAAHKQQHNDFVKRIFDTVDQMEQPQQPGPQHFTHQLRNMIIIHITLIDKKYATYIHILNRGMEFQKEEYSLPSEMFLG